MSSLDAPAYGKSDNLRVVNHNVDSSDAEIHLLKTAKPVLGGELVPVVSLGDASADAFGRLRVGQPHTLFDSKQLFDNQPLFWDDQEESGGSTTSVHDADTARSRMGVALNTAGVRTRQTFMRFNYQPSKGQFIMMTGVLSSGPVAGVDTRIGYFDDDNGVFFEQAGTTLQIVVRSSASGSPVDTAVTQANWNADKLDGTGTSGVTVDPSTTLIFWMDFEWLGVGTVRYGVVIDGQYITCHAQHHSNVLDEVYMSTPNLPCRYQIENDGTGAATTMDHICSTVISEGGEDPLGKLHYNSTDNTPIQANTAGVYYAIAGIRLKTTHLGSTISIEDATAISITNDDYEWQVRLNPTLAAAASFSDVSNSACQFAVGEGSTPSTTTVTGGTIITGGYVKSGNDMGSVSRAVDNAIRIGAAIDGTRDEIWLIVSPLAANADINGGLTWREVL